MFDEWWLICEWFVNDGMCDDEMCECVCDVLYLCVDVCECEECVMCDDEICVGGDDLLWCGVKDECWGVGDCDGELWLIDGDWFLCYVVWVVCVDVEWVGEGVGIVRG